MRSIEYSNGEAVRTPIRAIVYFLNGIILFIMYEQLSHPYDKMLADISGVKGFKSFEKFVLERWDIATNAVKAEIKAIYEFHNNGYLVEICSNANDEPDAKILINVNGIETKGIVEVAHLDYLFDTRPEIKKVINSELNTKKTDFFTKEMPEKGVFIQKEINGTIVVGPNVDLSHKITKTYKKKRAQHKQKYADYPEYLKVYYFQINAAPTRIDQFFGDPELLNLLKRGEVIILCTTYCVKDQLMHNPIIGMREVDVDIELKNAYFL